MKIFISIKKKWLQHRVYKYTLKYEDAISKSNYHFNLANNCLIVAAYNKEVYGVCSLEAVKKEQFEGNYYEHLASRYLRKKVDLDKKLQSLNVPKA